MHPLALNGCECRFISPEQLLIINGTGDVFIVTLLLQPSVSTVDGAHIKKVYSTVIPKCVLLCSTNYIFVGSQICDSVLLRYQPHSDNGEVYVTSNVPVGVLMCSSLSGIVLCGLLWGIRVLNAVLCYQCPN